MSVKEVNKTLKLKEYFRKYLGEKTNVFFDSKLPKGLAVLELFDMSNSIVEKTSFFELEGVATIESKDYFAHIKYDPVALAKKWGWHEKEFYDFINHLKSRNMVRFSETAKGKILLLRFDENICYEMVKQ